MDKIVVLPLALLLLSGVASAENLAVSVDESPTSEKTVPAAATSVQDKPKPVPSEKASAKAAKKDKKAQSEPVVQPGKAKPKKADDESASDLKSVKSEPLRAAQPTAGSKKARIEPDAGVSADSSNAKEETSRPSNVPKDRMPTLALKVSPQKVAVGEEITWELAVKRRKEDAVHLSGSANFGALELKSKSSFETPIDNDWVRDTLTVSLIGFDPGDITIPGQILTVVDVDGNIAEIETEKADITITSLIANEPEPALKEDTGQGEVVMEEDYLLLYILAGFGAALLVVLLTLLIRKLWAMRRPKSEPPPPPPRPAEEVAYEKLNTLKESKLLADGEFKEFHIRLSEAVREYIGNRYGFDSLELSSEELIQSLKKVSISQTEYDLVLDFLGETDLVKFAKVLPTITESEDLLGQSFGFVERTTPQAAATAENGPIRTTEKGDKQ